MFRKVKLYTRVTEGYYPISPQNNTQTLKAQQTPSPFTQSNILPTSNSISTSSVRAKDIADLRTDYMQKQQKAEPIKPLPPF